MRWLIGFFGLFLISFGVANAESGLDWLKTAAFAGHQTEYSGVFIYQNGNRLETSRITHLVEPDSEFERIESLDGANRVVVRHHGYVWHYYNNTLVQVNKQQQYGIFPSLLSDELSSLKSNYEIKELGFDTVAGYKTHVLLLQPKDNLRYAHKLWIGADDGLLLKTSVIDDKNNIVERYVFTEIKIGKDMDRAAIIASVPVETEDLSKISDKLDAVAPVHSGWVVDAMPSGFSKKAEVRRPMHGKRAPVTQLVYSDGLSTISVFIEPANADDEEVERMSSRGAVNIYNKVVDGHLYTVVGEVPPAAIMQVLDSIRYNGS